MRRDRRTFLILLGVLIPVALVSGATLASTDKSVNRKPVHTRPPRITGAPEVGRVLYASRGRWIGASEFTYRWMLCNAHGARCKVVGKARRLQGKPAVRVAASDVGRTIRATFVAGNKWGEASATSRATAVIRAAGPGTGTGSGSPSTPHTPGSLGSGQSFAHWLAWSNSVKESQIPWNGVTQVALDSLTSSTAGSSCSSDCTTLNTAQNGINRMNVTNWVSVIHQHKKLAIISIGGSTDQNWASACSAANLAGFARKLVSYMVSNGFDGVNLDIESLGGTGRQLALWGNCVRTISQDAHAAKTRAGKTPIVAEDVDQSWIDSTIANFSKWPDQFQLMYYGYPTGSYSCATGSPANTCTKVNSLVQELHNTAHIPYDKMLLGMSPGGNQAQCCYVNLGTTNATVSGRITSIPVSSISTAIPAGNIVLATTQSPPSDYQVLTTSGAAACSSHCSIPITGAPSWGSGTTANHSYPSGSHVQDAYAGPWDCGNFARYAVANRLEGVMIWDLQEEAGIHHGQFPCFDQVAPYLAPASP